MAETFRKDRLDFKISELGIYLDEDVKWTNENLIKRLGDYTLAHTKESIPWATKYVQSLECVMLCKHLKDEMKNFTAETNPMVSSDYIAENKENGFRHLLCYSPKDGFTLYSRKESVDTYLNTNFTDKILFIKDGLIKEPKDFINKLNYRFVLDGEIIVNSDGANFDGVQYESIEDYVQAVLGSNAERAKAFQKDGHRLIFKIFDVLYFEKDAKEHEEIEFKYDYSAQEPNEEEIAWIEKYYEKYLTSTGYKLEGKLTGKNKKLYTYLRTLKYLPKYDVRKYPFWKRRELRNQLITMLQKIGIPAEEVAHEDVNKIEYLDTQLKTGHEGCFLGKSKVIMADGTEKRIDKIQVGDMVQSYNNSTGKVEPKKVTNVFYNGLKPIEQWLSVSRGAHQQVGGTNKRASSGNYYHRIFCTRNHKFWNGVNYEEIDKLNYCYEYNPILDDFRKQALYGWLLSDGCIDTTLHIVRLYQKADTEYWKYTKEMYRPFCNNVDKTFISGKGSVIGILSILKRYTKGMENYHLNYKGGYTELINKMNEVAWAYFIMGDGSCLKDKQGLQLSTHSLELDDVKLIMQRFSKLFGTTMGTIKQDKRVAKNGYYISYWKEDTNKIFEKIGKYIHPSMLYKFSNREQKEFISYPTEITWDLQQVPIMKKELGSYKNESHSVSKGAWDIEVEDNHNYFVEHVLVHNCILKNKYAPYIAGMKSSRSHKACLKVKQSMANILDNLDKVEDFDVFITGANPPKSDRIKDMIGALNCSIYIIDENGETREHEIASVSGISHEWKRKFAKIDENGKITLNPEYLNKVIAINGLALTATNLKFQHAVIKDRNAIEFKAKQPTECVWEESVLKEMTLVRGR